ncbi:hypothetical protein GCM10027060_18920 [Nesterenkonia halophila]|uniref:helix-turn-helix transcriptional regulator n=1 Tax=Nesterenkonia halophila TaxID=302044 RepID=UPI001B86FF53|nr:helix-turn-helix domain-containing protein [Nesterenkonia halophila]
MTTIEELPLYMTTKQVSELTGVPEGTLKFYRSRQSGGPRSFALTPRSIRYAREDVMAWIEDRHAQGVGGIEGAA